MKTFLLLIQITRKNLIAKEINSNKIKGFSAVCYTINLCVEYLILNLKLSPRFSQCNNVLTDVHGNTTNSATLLLFPPCADFFQHRTDMRLCFRIYKNLAVI